MLVDRAKDMIIRAEHLPGRSDGRHQLPEIAEAAVVGRASAMYGEEPVLFVSLCAGADISTDRIHEHARQLLSKFKLPVEITILDDLPKNAVGKLDKPKLRRSLAENPQ